MAFSVGWRLLAYPALVYVLLSLAFFWMYVHPRRYVGGYTPADFGLKPENVKLRTADGLALDCFISISGPQAAAAASSPPSARERPAT
jgi:hypothetical protein